MNSNYQNLLEHLENGGEVTVMTALNRFHVGGLTSFISKLRRKGYPIESRREANITSRGYHYVYFMQKKSITL